MAYIPDIDNAPSVQTLVLKRYLQYNPNLHFALYYFAGQCDDIVMCDLFNGLPDEEIPMVGAVKVFRELCG